MHDCPPKCRLTQPVPWLLGASWGHLKAILGDLGWSWGPLGANVVLVGEVKRVDFPLVFHHFLQNQFWEYT
jgi:hypothetical protein